MTDLLTREEDLLREAYMAAVDASHSCGGSVCLEVSTEVWDYLKSLVAESTRSPWDHTMWDFPVVKKASWEGFRIDVVTRRVIA